MALPATAKAVVCALRQDIAKIEGRLVETLGDPSDDVREAGGRIALAGTMVVRRARVADATPTGTSVGDALNALSWRGLVEIHGEASRDAGAVSGFALALAGMAARAAALPLLWISTAEMGREAGRPYALGLAQKFGILPERLLLAEAEKLADVLWIAEEATKLGSLAAILLEVRGSPAKLDLTATLRLHRRALAAGHPLFLLRQAGRGEPTAAPLRLVVRPAPAAPRTTLFGALEGSIGPPAFHVSIDKNRTAAPAAMILQWNLERYFFEERTHAHAAENPVAMVAAPADGAHLPAADRAILAFPPAAGLGPSHHQPSREQYAAHRRHRRAG